MSDRDPGTGQFKLGHTGIGGRPKGARNRLGEAFLEALADDFDQNGIAAIEAVRKDRPHEYLKVVASILPKQVDLSMESIDDMTDADLEQRVRQLASVIGIEVRATASAHGAGPESDEAPTEH